MTGRTLGPGRHLADRLLLDDGFVAAEPTAVEWRHEELALLLVRLAAQREEGVGTEHSAQVEIEVVGNLGTGREQLLDLGRIADDDGFPDHRHVDGERGAVALSQPAHRPQRGGDP